MATATHHTAQPRHQYKPVKSGKLKFRGLEKFYDLPFVARRFGSSTPCWNVPATGGYFGGYKTGEALAVLFLEQQRVGQKNMSALTIIIESMMMAYEREGGKAMHSQPMEQWTESFNSFRGQYVGFLNTIQSHLMRAFSAGGYCPPTVRELMDHANKGLEFDEKAYFASLED